MGCSAGGFIPAVRGHRLLEGDEGRILGFIPAVRGHQGIGRALERGHGFIPAVRGHLFQ